MTQYDLKTIENCFIFWLKYSTNLLPENRGREQENKCVLHAVEEKKVNTHNTTERERLYFSRHVAFALAQLKIYFEL